MRTVYIYELIDPRNNLVRYVGKTEHIKSRYRQHLSLARLDGKKLHVHYWIRQLLAVDKRPILKILEIASDNDWYDVERKWIKFYRDAGYNLTNITNGGESPNVTDETREKLRQWHLGKRHSEETKKKIGLTSWGRQANLGHRHTEETKKKISNAKTGIKRPKEYIQSAIDGRKGYHHSEETKRKIGLSNSIALKGHKMSEEAKKKLSEFNKKYWTAERREMARQRMLTRYRDKTNEQ